LLFTAAVFVNFQFSCVASCKLQEVQHKHMS